MLSAVPDVDTDYDKLLLVHLNKGARVGKHAHKEHTVLYYPSGGSDVVVSPSAGMIIYLPPHTAHYVPPVSADRLSVAMLVEVK
jgi:uncharacterized RmlC-like cupin family protein